MGLLTWLQTLADANEANEDTVTYQCQRCREEFEEAAIKMTQIRCPDCQSARVKLTS